MAGRKTALYSCGRFVDMLVEKWMCTKHNAFTFSPGQIEKLNFAQ